MSTDIALTARQAVQLRDIKPETQLAIHSSGRDYLVSPKDIIEWVAPAAPIGEAKRFLLICQTAGLNPVMGDADLVNYGGKWQTIIRKNGYLKCARRDPDYDGHESGVTVQKFNETTPKGVKVKVGPLIDLHGTIVPDGHLLVGGWCKLYRKGISRPFSKRVSLEEYDKKSPGPWQTIKCTMIEKVAIAHACRESIDLLAGTYDESEFPPPPIQTTATVTVAALPPMTPDETPTAIEADPDRISGVQADEIGRLIHKLKMSDRDVKFMLAKKATRRIDELSYMDGCAILRELTFQASRLDWDPLGDNPPAPQGEPPAAIEAEIEESGEVTS